MVQFVAREEQDIKKQIAKTLTGNQKNEWDKITKISKWIEIAKEKMPQILIISSQIRSFVFRIWSNLKWPFLKQYKVKNLFLHNHPNITFSNGFVTLVECNLIGIKIEKDYFLSDPKIR